MYLFIIYFAQSREFCLRSILWCVISQWSILFRFRSKSIRFGLMSNQEVQKVAEFHVFERTLYQMPARAPMKNGILDPRLVRKAPPAA